MNVKDVLAHVKSMRSGDVVSVNFPVNDIRTKFHKIREFSEDGWGDLECSDPDHITISFVALPGNNELNVFVSQDEDSQLVCAYCRNLLTCIPELNEKTLDLTVHVQRTRDVDSGRKSKSCNGIAGEVVSVVDVLLKDTSENTSNIASEANKNSDKNTNIDDDNSKDNDFVKNS